MGGTGTPSKSDPDRAGEPVVLRLPWMRDRISRFRVRSHPPTPVTSAAEFSGELIPDETLQRVLGAAHAAPSVGNTQPWDFIVVRNQDTVDTFAEHVAGRRRAFADSLPRTGERRSTPSRSRGFGRAEPASWSRTTRPAADRTSGPTHDRRHRPFSAVLAIQNLWLAAAAENIGVGWVSFYARVPHGPAGIPATGPPHRVAVRRQGGPVPGGSGSGTLRLADGRDLSDAIHWERF
ncbi:5,6-dimethylbenzimidazole synthase [Rhodococcus hoagii]|nr:5,6-dimethylbenzimidazole synthase [Prescottella equi]